MSILKIVENGLVMLIKDSESIKNHSLHDTGNPFP